MSTIGTLTIAVIIMNLNQNRAFISVIILKSALHLAVSKAKRNISMYWSAQDILSRNAMFNFVVGGRGTGKTYDCKWRLIRRALRKHRTFIYLRRYETELEDRGQFFKDVLIRFPQYEFKVDGMKAYAKRKQTEEQEKRNPAPWQLVCYFSALSKSLTKKSVPYSDVDYIVFDEFIIDKQKMHYLPNEAPAFLDFYNTVDRFEDRVKVLFLANAVALINPYFVYFGLTPRKDKRFTMKDNGYHCVEMVQSEAFKAYVNNTRFGQMIANTAYYDYAVDNRFNDQNDKFIAKKPEDAEFLYAITFDAVTYGIWADYLHGRYYINDKVPYGRTPFILTRDDMTPNLLMLERSSFILKSLKSCYQQGSIFYDSIKTRELFSDVLDYLGVK